MLEDLEGERLKVLAPLPSIRGWVNKRLGIRRCITQTFDPENEATYYRVWREFLGIKYHVVEITAKECCGATSLTFTF